MRELFSLTGQLAVVTGAARGIGRAAAHALAAYGSPVLLVDRLTDQLAHTAVDLRAKGAEVATLVADITHPDTVDRVLEATQTYGPVRILVNAAGVMRRSDITELNLADLDTLLGTNVSSTVRLTQGMLPTMIAQSYGKIINVGSLGSVRALERRTAYATSKAALAQYTVSLASEVGVHGVRANVIAPGYVATDMASHYIFENDEMTSRLLHRIPLGRFADPDDLAGAFVFLAAPASDYLTGQIVLVDGGWTTT